MIFASSNKGKLKEISEIFSEYKIKSLDEADIKLDVVEDRDTFIGNATKKAMEIYEIAKEPVIADDSGLCIDALNNFPGVKTARFLGENKTDRERNSYIIDKLQDIENRMARVVCELVYFDGKRTIIGEGILEGNISLDFRGENGFGFDEIFELENGKTLAELSSDQKNKISARYMAAIDLKKKLRDLD